MYCLHHGMSYSVIDGLVLPFLPRDTLCALCGIMGIATVSHPSVRPSVRDVDVPWPYK